MRSDRVRLALRVSASRIAERVSRRGGPSARSGQSWDDIEQAVDVMEVAVTENQLLERRLTVLVEALEDQLVPLLDDEQERAS